MPTQRKLKVTSLEEIKEVIHQHRQELRREFHVDRIGVFGSYARGTQKKRSDVDFLVTFDKSISLYTLGGLYEYLKEITGANLDVVPLEDLRPEFSDGVMKDVVYI